MLSERRNRSLLKNDDKQIKELSRIKIKRSLIKLATRIVAIQEKYQKNRQEICLRYSNYFKKAQETYEKNFNGLLESVRNKKHHQLTLAHKKIVYFHFGSKYDGHFVFKSHRLKFDKRIIERFGLLSILLEGGYVEFRDSMRLTGATGLAKLCEGFDVNKEHAKKQFPHDFMTVETLYYIGKTP